MQKFTFYLFISLSIFKMLCNHKFIMRANILNIVNNKIVATFNSISQSPTEIALMPGQKVLHYLEDSKCLH